MAVWWGQPSPGPHMRPLRALYGLESKRCFSGNGGREISTSPQTVRFISPVSCLGAGGPQPQEQAAPGG